jgi:hypothetical protein
MENTYTNYYWEAIDEALIYEVIPDEKIIQVSKDTEYTDLMENQNDRIVKRLSDKYPTRSFRKSKWNYHDFGSYQEVEEQLSEVIHEDEDNLSMLW